MKPLFFSLIATIPFLAVEAKSLEIGAEMPKLTKEMTLTNTDGKAFDFQSVKKPAGTLIVFSCNHCPYAVKWEERIRDIGNKYSKSWKEEGSDKSFGPIGVVMINSNDWTENPIDSPAEMKKRAETLKLQFPYVVDGTSRIAEAYGATKTPEIFLFNGEGKLVYKGAVDDNYDVTKAKTPHLANAIESMLKGKPIAQPVTRAIGCSIKSRVKKS